MKAFRSLALSLLLLTLGSPLCAQSAETSLRFVPPAPDTSTAVTAEIRGSGPICPPRITGVSREGSLIRISYAFPECMLPAIGPFLLRAELGLLPAGVYRVEAVLAGHVTHGETLVVQSASSARTFLVAPNVVAVEGGEEIRLIGENLISCAAGPSPPVCEPFTVRIGNQPATVLGRDQSSILVRVPPQGAGAVDVVIEKPGQPSLRAVAALYYMARGTLPDRAFFEPVLYPVAYTGPGAFGSQWVSELSLRNENDYPISSPFGSMFESICVACDIRPQPRRTVVNRTADAVGHLDWFARQAMPRLHFGLLVRDTTRQASTLGTEIPVVRESELYGREFQLLNIPTDSRYRITLRLYNIARAAVVPVLIEGMEGGTLATAILPLTGESGSRAASVVIGDLAAAYPAIRAASSIRIVVTPQDSAPNYWGFVSITNNETQQITLVTPQ